MLHLLAARARQNHQAPVTSGTTWNPLDKASQITLSNGNLTAQQGSTSTWDLVRGTTSHGSGSGKWYFEVHCDSLGTYLMMGLANSSAPLTSYVGATSNGWAYYNTNGTIVYNGTQGGSYPTYTTGDVVMVAADMTNGYLWFGKNGVWINSGNPAAGTGYINASFPLTGALFPAVSPYDANEKVTGRFTASAYTYTIPSGFSSWS